MTLFERGEQYVRQEIHDEFGGRRQHGISPCGESPYVFLFTGGSGKDHGYQDEFKDDGTVIYTGEGREGDMTYDQGNKAILQHQSDGRQLHLFKMLGKGMVEYVGQYEYVDHFEQQLSDTNNNLRRGIRFVLAPVSNEIGEEESLGTETTLSEAELYERAKAASSSEPATTTSVTGTHRRASEVRKYALAWADGTCQGCDQPAPFETSSGSRYLEVHHVHRLSDGGPDDPESVIALCPNCHRRVHNGADKGDFNQQLIERLEAKHESREVESI
ncbi:HNH endonuclease [Haladaptatus sp. NG-SE-30]